MGLEQLDQRKQPEYKSSNNIYRGSYQSSIIFQLLLPLTRITISCDMYLIVLLIPIK